MKTELPLDDLLAQVSMDDVERDPYPLYDRLRAEAPVAFVPGIGEWLVTGFAEVKAVHQDKQRFDTLMPAPVIECIGEHNILGVDGPQHQRYRKALHACLAPRMVEGYADSQLLPIVRERLDALADRPGTDLVTDYFEPISVLGLARIIGIPDVDAPTLQRWFHGIILGSSNFENDRDVADEANGISREIDDRMWEVFERIDAEPDESIVSHLLRTATGGTLTERVLDIMPTLKIVLGGGLQEPGHGAGTLTFALLADDALRARVAADPDALLPAAIEESIRWVAPIQIDVRRTNTAVELGGVTIPADTFVMASLGAANRDATVFGPHAERFDLDRPRAQHLGFGFGSHFCSGNYFGRVLMRLGVRELLERYPRMHLDPAHTPFFRGFAFRAPAALHVTLA